MTEEIFIKILNNLATEAEKSSFYNLLEEDEALREIFYAYKNIYTASKLNSIKDIHPQNDSFQRFWNRIKPVKPQRMVGLWVRYAAVFVMALSMGFLLRYIMPVKNEKVKVFTQKIQYTSEKGSVSTIHLEDGSAIWLSSDSKLTLSRSSNGEMSATLNGEAYFDMVPDTARKFAVDLGYFKIKDIGTKFNIRAYNAEQNVFAALADGAINLYKDEAKTILTMAPGEFMNYDKQANRIAVSKQDPSIATAWKDGKFVFINKSLAEICRELENWYNVEIIIRNRSVANARYTSVIKRTTTVKMVLKMLALTDQINYQIDERKEVRDIVYIY
ncbi:MAG TPA: FecR domain-containing protein [Prolixibacteraceae bacterium]|jgi:ferric-dicitrate binding protein FerR (iron transport regulator)